MNTASLHQFELQLFYLSCPSDRISERIKDLDIVKEYHRVEQQIHNNKQIEQKMKDLKKNQKQSVNLQNYGKTEALKQSELINICSKSFASA